MVSTSRFRLLPIFILFCGASLQAQMQAIATVTVGCSGKPNAQVAIRWGHPDHDENEYVPLFTVHCSQGVQTEQVPLLDQKSEFEIQTEGGIDTSYAVKVSIPGPQNQANYIDLTYDDAPDPVIRGTGFTVARSSGPNKYGEQNFRVGLPAGTTAATKIIAQSSGDRSSAQMALRWGHPDFNDHGYFPLWTIKAGTAQEKDFSLKDAKSEFEIQTEGGEGTKYHLSIWLDLGKGLAMQPNIEIAHQLEGTQITSATSNDGVTFEPSKGNVYGEGNVRVTVPWLPSNRIPPSASNGGINLVYNYGDVMPSTTPPTPIQFQFRGNLLSNTSSSPSGAGKNAFQTNSPPRTLDPGPTNLISDSESGLQPGSWTLIVGPEENNTVYDLTQCTVQITAGTAPTVTVDRPTRTCR